MSRSVSATQDLEINSCGACRDEVKAGDKAMQCDLCNKWVHCSCCTMPDELYKILNKFGNKNTGTKWFCKSCEIHFGKIRMEVKTLGEKQIQTDLKIEATDETVKKVKKDIEKLRNEFEEYVKEKQTLVEIPHL